VAETTLPAVPLRSSAPFGNGIRARVTGLRYGTVTETGPGQLTGSPAITFRITLYNTSRAAAGVDGVSVNAYYGARKTPAVPTNLYTTRPIHGRVAAGSTATGSYAFAIPPSQRHDVTLTVWYAQGAPTVVLRGSAR
jgi:hypothetical protein